MRDLRINYSTASKVFDLGPGLSGRVGLIVLADDPVAESEVAATLLNSGVSLSVTRMPTPMNYRHDTLKTLEPDVIAALGMLLPADRLSTVALACGALAGSLGRAHLQERISALRPGVTFTDPGLAALAVLRAQGARRISLLMTPEDEAINQAAAQAYVSQGFEIAWVGTLALRNDLEMSTLSIASICAALNEAASTDADTILVPCTAMRTWEAIPHLDATAGRKVLTGNRAMALHAQSLASGVALEKVLNGG